MRITLTVEVPEYNIRPSHIATLLTRATTVFAAVFARQKVTAACQYTTAKGEVCTLTVTED